MAGHSKWSNIKRKKAAIDSKRGKIWTKLVREITVAARIGGPDIGSNPRLRDAVAEAKSNNLPKDTLERAIKRGSGQLEGETYESITYEGYGPAGVALLIESLTDNRNRSVAEIRATLTRNSGNLGESGSVAWIFEKKGILTVSKKDFPDEERIMEVALDAGADDLMDEGEVWEIRTPPTELFAVREALEKADIRLDGSELSAIPKTTVNLEGENAEKMLKLMDLLEDLDDVQKVYANFEIDEKELERLSGN